MDSYNLLSWAVGIEKRADLRQGSLINMFASPYSKGNPFGIDITKYRSPLNPVLSKWLKIGTTGRKPGDWGDPVGTGGWLNPNMRKILDPYLHPETQQQPSQPQQQPQPQQGAPQQQPQPQQGAPQQQPQPQQPQSPSQPQSQPSRRFDPRWLLM